MERGEGAIKHLHSIWKWNIFLILPILSFYFLFGLSEHLCKVSSTSLQTVAVALAFLRPSVCPKTFTSTWNDGWWNYSKNMDLPSAETLSRSLNGLGFYSDSCFCSGAGGARDHLETHEDEMKTGLILHWWLMNKRFILVWCGFYLWKHNETPFIVIFITTVYLHILLLLFIFILFYRYHKWTTTMSLMPITSMHLFFFFFKL